MLLSAGQGLADNTGGLNVPDLGGSSGEFKRLRAGQGRAEGHDEQRGQRQCPRYHSAILKIPDRSMLPEWPEIVASLCNGRSVKTIA